MRIINCILLLLSGCITMASTLEVCKECPVSSIGEAIGQAADGDTILILGGSYKEHNLALNKNISIIGLNNAGIDGDGKGSVFHCTADSFSISGLRIENTGMSYTKEHAAILVHGAKKFTIRNNRINNVFFGFLIEKSQNGVIADNRISSNARVEASSGNGIHLWHCKAILIENNELNGLRDGIYFEFVSKSRIVRNHSFGNLRYGLHFMFSDENTYIGNMFEKNGAGVAVMFSRSIQMTDNTFQNNWGSASYGLLLKEITDSEIRNNRFTDNTIGINVEGANRMIYQGNIFYRNGWAIKVIGACYENVFESNDFVSNSFDLSYSSKLNDNEFRRNYWSDYSGYDLDKDGYGDVPHRPVNLFSYIVSGTPESIILLRSIFIYLLNFSERVSPVFTPENLVDASPTMNPNQ